MLIQDFIAHVLETAKTAEKAKFTVVSIHVHPQEIALLKKDERDKDIEAATGFELKGDLTMNYPGAYGLFGEE